MGSRKAGKEAGLASLWCHVKIWPVASIMLILLVTQGRSHLRVEYLRSAERLNATSLYDHFFCCNAEGTVLQWGVNGLSLGGYSSSDVGVTVVSSGNGYNYTTTLLSARQTEGNDFLFDSVLIISTVNGQTQTFDVSCTNNINITFTSNIVEPKISDNGITRKDDKVGFEYVLATRILQNTAYRTYIYTCGTNSTSQLLGVPRIRAFGFTATDRIGDTRNLMNAGIVSFQVILADRKPYTTTTFAFITTISNFSIVCSYGNFEQTFESDIELFSLPSSPLSTIQSTSFDMRKPMITLNDDSSGTATAYKVQVSGVTIRDKCAMSIMLMYIAIELGIHQ